MSDYTIDWSHTNIDGSNTVSGTDGSVGFTVATPENIDHDQWMKGTVGGYDGLKAWDVNDPTKVKINFHEDVQNVSFEIFDVDSDNCTWDDRVTVIAKDADGNILPVHYSNLAAHHTVSGNQLNTHGFVEDGINGSGAADSVTVTIAGPIASLEIIYDNGAGAPNSGTIGLSDIHFDAVVADPDGTVEGTAGADKIDVFYTGDPEGDMVDNDDAILPGDTGDDDLIYGFGGDDHITAGNGADEVYGGTGNDTIIGDGGTGRVRESFEWDKATEYQVDTTFTQDTGAVNVTYTRLVDLNHHDSKLGVDALNVSGIDSGAEVIDTDSSLRSETNGIDGKGKFQLEFSAPVMDVNFNINDIDGDGVVRVFAYDVHGNKIEADLTGGSKLTLLDTDGVNGTDTADSQGGYADATTNPYNLNVVIPGPVSRIVVEHTQNGHDNSGIYITDMYYDVMTGAGAGAGDTLYGDEGHDYIVGGEGDDTAFGGAGNDTIDDGPGSDQGTGKDSYYGGDGNDTIWGGLDDDLIDGGNDDDRLSGEEGNDSILGGAGRDLIFGGSGDDVADGGTGDDEIWMGTGNDVASGGEGNDWIHGESGNDELFGGAGDDMLFGEGGNDTLTGGDDRDVIKGGVGDTVDGGAGGDDFDVLDLTGQGGFYLVGPDGTGDPIPDSNGNGIDGTVIFVDGDGAPTGETLSFTEIEKVLGNEVNRGPVAKDDAATTDEDTPVTIDVLGNDTDADGDALTVTDASSPDGTVTINPDGTLTFAPDENFNGDTTITYTIDDGQGGTDTATVVVTVTPVNDDPVAVDDVASTDEDTSVVIDLIGNDTDLDGDALTIGTVTVPANQGTVVDNGDGTVTFTPAPDFNGDATIDYTVVDGNGGEDAGQAVVTVDAVNDGPVANDDAATTDEDTPVTIDVLGNDTDADGDALTVTDASSPDGTVTINPDGTLTFAPDENFNGDATITYTIDDGQGGTDTATVVVTVTPVNDAPDAVDDSDSTDFNTPITVDLLANDTDVDGDTLTVTEATVPADQGTLVNNGDGTVTFTPAMGFSGTATISYAISDGYGGTDSAVHAVTVSNAPLDGTVEGTAGDDVIDSAYRGDPEGDRVDNNDAILPGDVEDDDLIYGFDGNDTIRAGNGDDEVYGGEGDDSINGQGGNDTLFGDAGNDIINGGGVEDTIFGGSGNDVIDGDSGNDSLEGNGGNDSILGGGGDDIIGGGQGDDTIDGENNNDMIFGGAGNDSLAGGSGDDKIEGGSGNDIIEGGIGNDDLWGASGDDSVDGGAGNDTIATAEGSDIVKGGDGNDIIDTGNDESPATGQNLPDVGYPGVYPADLDPNDDLDTVFGGAGDDTISTGDDDDTIFGGDGQDLIDAGVDDDYVEGGADNDTIIGSEGNDEIYGQDGDDTIYGGLVTPGPADALNLPDDLDGDGDSNDPGEDLVTYNNNDTLFGGAGNDTIFGADDDDSLYGGIGDDFLDGGVDDDLIDGGDGADSIIGGQGNDRISGQAGNDSVDGGDGNDTIFGGAGDDILEGGDGDDFIATGPGQDTAYGGAGNDLVAGNEGDDVLFGGDGDDTVTGLFGSDTITGGDGADLLRGGRESDTFLGGNGGDVVEGGEDQDGLDVDVLDLTGSNVDFITYVDDDPEAGTVTFLDGTTMTFSEIENVIPCFTPGTTIATPKGERLVEELREGDRIITRDNGIQEIRWVGRKDMSGKALVANAHLKPILVRAGALGNGLPERDMLVSPNHRVLVASEKTQLYFEEREVLAAAKHLVGSEGIHAVDVMGTSYIHFMFDRHEVVLSNGAWTESFQPGDYSLKGIGNSQRNEIFELFPELQSKTGLRGYQSARRALKKHEARLLVK